MPESAPTAPVIATLPMSWRAHAAELRRYGAELQAHVLEAVADELEDALQGEADALLTLEQAAEESGYSADHLGREVREGRIPNAGRRHAPRLRRGDLPRKPGALRSAPPIGISRVQIARSVVHPHEGNRS